MDLRNHRGVRLDPSFRALGLYPRRLRAVGASHQPFGSMPEEKKNDSDEAPVEVKVLTPLEWVGANSF